MSALTPAGAARRIAVWSLPGQAQFASVVGRALDCKVYVSAEIPACDVVHIVGMYDCPTFATTLRRTQAAARRVYHWTGPDAANCFWPDRLPEGLHLCPGEAVRDLLHRRGIEAQILPLPTRVHAPVTPFADSPVIAVYGGTNPHQYGMSMAQALYECMPGVGFLSYGKGQFAEALMPEVIARSQVYLRLRRVADGGISTREYLAAGRRVISTDDLPFVSRVARDNLPGVLAAVKAALAEPEPDAEAAAYWAPRNTDAAFAEKIGHIL